MSINSLFSDSVLSLVIGSNRNSESVNMAVDILRDRIPEKVQVRSPKHERMCKILMP